VLGNGKDNLRQRTERATSALKSGDNGSGRSRAVAVPGCYRMTPNGLWWFPDEEAAEFTENAGYQIRAKEVRWLAGEFEVDAMVHDGTGNNWGLLLRWRDFDRREHEWCMPRAGLGGKADLIWQTLLSRGLEISTALGSRNRLLAFLSSATSDKRVRIVTRTGWHEGGAGYIFVLPDRAFGQALTARVKWLQEEPIENLFRVAGTAEDWRDSIGRCCAGNTRLTFGVSAAFAAPLLHLLGAESGGFHFRGSSSVGKSTITLVAGSVWGGSDGPLGFGHSWRTTSNRLESTAEMHSDALLVLDELSQVDGREAGQVVYMLFNGVGKGRSARDGSAQRTRQWRVLLLSSGEISLADKMAEVGRRSQTGQEVRLVDISADAGKGLGAFEELHGAESPGAFVEQLQKAARQFYGTPAREFLEMLTQQHAASLAFDGDEDIGFTNGGISDS
jgi:putative DNA primase/helicase